MATFSNIDGEESATVTFTVAAVSLTRNSSAELQEILSLGDPDISTNVARVLSVAPDSTMAGLGVRIIGGPSSLADFPVRVIFPSTAANNPVVMPSTQSVQVKNSTIGDLLASVQQNSTTWAVQVDGRVRAQNSTIGDFLASVQQNSTVWQVQQGGYVAPSTTIQISSVGGAVIVRSSAADFLATISGNVGQASTVWAVQHAGPISAIVNTSSGGGVEGSTAIPAQNVIGLHVRLAPSSVQTIGVSTAGASATNTVLVSSQANPIKVWSYCITSTVIVASTVSFRSSLAAVKWPMVLGSGSSGITGANLASQPPHPLFQTDANTALTFHVPTAGAEYSIALSYST